MNPVVATKALAAASANNIATSQSGTADTPLTLNGSTVSGGIAKLDTQRRVLITSAGNDSGIKFLVSGTNDSGSPISQSITGPNATTAATTLDFLTVSSITPSGNTASTVTAGTNTTGSTQWFSVDWIRDPVNIAIGVQCPSGTNCQIDHTYDDPNWMPTPWGTTVEPKSAVPPFAWITGSAITANTEVFITAPCFAYRLTVNSGTGTVTMQAMQAGYRGA